VLHCVDALQHSVLLSATQAAKAKCALYSVCFYTLVTSFHSSQWPLSCSTFLFYL